MIGMYHFSLMWYIPIISPSLRDITVINTTHCFFWEYSAFQILFKDECSCVSVMFHWTAFLLPCLSWVLFYYMIRVALILGVLFY